jgi:hypothetical protein
MYHIKDFFELEDFINYNQTIKKLFEPYYKAYKIFLILEHERITEV